MKVTVFGDVHGNLPALEQMLAEERDSDRFVCLGDVVNYGPWSNECVDLVESLDGCVRLMGNHDRMFLEDSCEGANPQVRRFFEQTRPRFDRPEYLRAYREEWGEWGWSFRHTLGGAYLYPDSPVEPEGRQFVGHSHVQFLKYRGENLLCNPGSVGQNRREIDVVNYVLLFPEEGALEMKALSYDLGLLIGEMREREYPEECINYYLDKR